MHHGLPLRGDAQEAGEEEEEDPSAVQGGDGEEVEKGQGKVDGHHELKKPEGAFLGRPARFRHDAQGPHHPAIGVAGEDPEKTP